MASKTIQYLASPTGLRDEDYANALLDQIKLPNGGAVSVIIFARNSFEVMRIHFSPLSRAQLRSEHVWWNGADVRANISERRFQSITDAARDRWPGVRIFQVTVCMCCSAVEDLLAYECKR